ncbi:MAG TPA: GntR family transcriptional regulator [Caldilineae bacterium]|nr:GntR family transcriptional regulator [Caldilineae bacterium]
MKSATERVPRRTLAAHIHDVLMEKILSGEFPPGTRLKDNELAEMFGTSNTPVREAVRELEKDGLVEILPYRGCQVKRIDVEEIREIYDVRIALEELAAKLAAERITVAQLESMEELVEEFEMALRAGDVRRAMEAGSAFHDLMVRAAGNKTLLRIHRQLQNRIEVTRRMDQLAYQTSQWGDHRAILEALRQHDPEKAAALITKHIAIGKERVLRALVASSPEPQSEITS